MLSHGHGRQFFRHFHSSLRITHRVDIASRILYEDNHLLVINKPSGSLVQGGNDAHHNHRLPSLPVNPSSSVHQNNVESTNLLDEIKEYLKQRDHKKGQAWLGLVHRLDRPTSGDASLYLVPSYILSIHNVTTL